MRNAMKTVAVMLIIMLFFAGCGQKEGQQNVDEKSEVSGLRVKVVPSRIGSVRNMLKYNGIIRGHREVSITPGMSSWITNILVKAGDRVRQGQLLVKLSPEQYKQAEAQYNAARESYERMKTLYEQGSISRQRYDEVEAAYKAAKAGFELAAKNTELRAPFSGIVASVNMEEGSYFNAMMSPTGILTVVDLSKVKVELDISDKHISWIKENQKAYLKCDAFPDTIFVGKVKEIDDAADPYSGTYKITTIFDNKNEKLKSGMFARVEIVIEEADSVIVIPQNAVV
ncbi:hypothetical protein DRQ33_06100, partial [bacterium]